MSELAILSSLHGIFCHKSAFCITMPYDTVTPQQLVAYFNEDNDTGLLDYLSDDNKYFVELPIT